MATPHIKTLEEFTEISIGENTSFETNFLVRIFKEGEEIRFVPLKIDIELLHRILFNEGHTKWAEEVWDGYYHCILSQYLYTVDSYEMRARMSNDIQRLFKVSSNLSSVYQIIDNKALVRIEKTKTSFLIDINYKVMV